MKQSFILIRQKILAVLISCLLVGFSHTALYATHWYGGQLSSTQGSAPGEICFTLTTIWNIESSITPDVVNVGDIFDDAAGINLGDGTFILFEAVVTVVNLDQQWFEAVMTFCHTYPCAAEGQDCSTAPSYNVEWGSCCKVSELANNTDDGWELSTTVHPCSDNNSPISSIPPFIKLPLCEVTTIGSSFTIPFNDPDGDPLVCSLGTFPDFSSTQPPGLTLTPGSCDFTLLNPAALAGQIWNAYVCVDDGCSQNCLDFMISIEDCTCPPTPPAFSEPMVDTYSVCVGQSINFDIDASDPNGDDLILFFSGLPLGANINILNNDSANPTGDFSWTPGIGDVGTYIVNLIVSDDCSDAQNPISIEVTSIDSELLSSATLACQDDPAISLILSDDGVSAGSYASVIWTGNTGPLSATNVADPSFSTATPGEYNLSVEAFDSDGCIREENIIITIEALPDPPTNPISIEVCTGGDISAGISAECGIAETAEAEVTNCENGSATYDMLNNTWTLIGTDDSFSCDVTVCITKTVASNCSFNWIYSTNDDDAFYDPLLYSINGTLTNVINSGTSGSGSINLSLNAGDTFCLIQESTDGCCGAATSVITTDCFDGVMNEIQWFDSSVGGNLQASGSPLDLTTAGLMAEEGAFDASVSGTYTFYAACVSENGCLSPTIPVEVVLSSANLNMTSTAPFCNGDTNGTATAGTDGLFAPYTYLWSNGQTTETATGLSDGTYTVTVTDSNACTSVDQVTLTEPTAVDLGVSVTSDYNGADISCAGASDGEATATGSGGVGPYTYLWSNGQTDAIATNLPAGIYTVEVTDANACMNSAIINITEPSPIVCDAIINDALCAGDSGSAIAFISGGVGGYSYEWLDAGGASLGTDDNISILVAGDYTLVANDLNGCSCSFEFSITEPEPLEIACGGNSLEGANGSISPFWYNTHIIAISGGSAPYELDVEHEGYVNWSIENLSSNSASVSINYADNAEWCISVIDANGCATGTASFDCCNDDGVDMGNNPSIPGANGNTLDIEGVIIGSESGVNAADGSIDVSISGCSTEPICLWSGPNGFEDDEEDISGLESGLYNVTITCDGETTTGWYWVPLDRSGGRLKDGVDVNEVAIEVYPNPFTDYTNLDFTLNKSMDITVEVFSIDGKRMKLLFDGKAQGGVLHNLPIYQNDLAGAGTYTCIISTEKGDVFYKKFVLVD